MTNQAGINPIRYAVLVLPDGVDHTFKDSVIIKPDAMQTKEELAASEGVVIAVGVKAWEGESPAPVKEGDRVIFSRYAGQTRVGKDGQTYRMMQDTDIIAVLDEVSHD